MNSGHLSAFKMKIWVSMAHLQTTKVEVSQDVDVDSVKDVILERMGVNILPARVVLRRADGSILDPMRTLARQQVYEGEHCELELLPPVETGAHTLHWTYLISSDWLSGEDEAASGVAGSSRQCPWQVPTEHSTCHNL